MADNEHLTQVHTHESDWEDDGAHNDETSGVATPAEPSHAQSVENGSGLEEGMLPRDLPKRTTFHDPVAERQMSQTDAKLFYQRSQIDIRSSSGGWSQSTPLGSPVMASGSRGTTDYGGDSLILETEEGKYRITFSGLHI